MFEPSLHPSRVPGYRATPTPGVTWSDRPADAAASEVDAPPRDWGAVCVEAAELAGNVDGDGALHVRAVAALGPLLPADVRIEIHAGRRGDDGEWVRTPTGVRLWSARAYHNGRFLFEGALEASELAGAEAVGVCVTPARGGGAASAVFRWLPARPGAQLVGGGPADAPPA